MTGVRKSKALEKADKYIRQNKLKPAIDELMRYVQANPDDVNRVNIINKIGDLFAQMGNKESAIEYFQRSIDYYVQEGFLTKAIAILKKVLRMDDENVRAMEQLADLYMQEGLQHEAKRQYLNIAEKYRREGLTKRALEAYRRIVDMDPKNVQSRIKLAELFVSEGLQQEAVEQMISLSKTLRENGDLEGAEKILLKTRKLEIPDPTIDLNLAKVMMLRGDLNGAEKILEAASARFTRNPMIMELLGTIRMERKDFDGAFQVLSQVFQMDGSRDKALRELMDRQLEGGSITKAWKSAQPILEKLMRNEEFGEATAMLRQFTEKAEHFAPALQKLALVYEKGGDKVFLISTLEKLANAYKMDGNVTGAEKAFKQLAQLDPMNYDYKSALQDLGSSFVPETEEKPGETVADTPLDAADEFDMEDTRIRQRGTVAEAEMYIEYGLKKKAYRLLESLLKETPFDIKANKMFARMCVDKGEIGKASKCYLNLSEAYINKKDWDKAEGYLDRSEKVLPGSSGYLRKMLAKERSGDDSLDEETMLHLDDLEMRESEPALDAGDESVEIDADDLSGYVEDVGPESESVSEDMLFGESVDSVADLEVEESIPISGDADSLELDLQAGAPTVDMSAQAPFDTTQLSDASGSVDELDLDEESELELTDEDSVILEPGSLDESAIPDLGDVDLELGEKETPKPSQPKAEGVDLSDELEEVHFYLSQNMVSEAGDMLQTLELDHPGHPELEKLRREVDAARMVAGAGEAGMESDDVQSAIEDQFLDLQAEFGADLDMFADNTELTDTQAKEQIKSVDELFQEFKQGVEEQIDQEDYETHYNLGIAYKEMGLHNEAVEEFAKASHDNSRFLDCCFMIATVYEETGDVNSAIEWLDSGVERARSEKRDLKPLLYEAGRILENAGEMDRALKYYTDVHKLSPDFRDVADKIGS